MADDLNVFLTSSANLLGSRGANNPLFSPLMTNDDPRFDDGPGVRRPRDPSLGSMDNLSGSYAYLQGVEMTKQAQYDAGLVKIWSGEPQHRLSPSVFGQDKNFFPDRHFADMDLFDPVRFLESQDAESPLEASIFTFPIVTGDNDQLENFNANGIIEPLTIRASVAFFSIEVPFESHAVRSTLMCGNTDQINGTDRVMTVDCYEPTRQAIGYLDMVDIIEGHPLNGFFRHEFASTAPFSDSRLVRNVAPDARVPSDMSAALSLMTGSTDNYVRHDQRSATCGWYYDNNPSVGTDSLTFGGMTY